MVDVQGTSFIPGKDQVVFGTTSAAVNTGSTATDLWVTVPQFTGTFPTASCSAGGVTGVSNVPTSVDVSVTDAATGCTGSLTGGFTYIPNDTSCRVPPPPLPRASFTVTTAPASFTVIFSDTSTGNPVIFSWEFGDGTTSIQENPVHTYAISATYVVTLTVTNAAGSSAASQFVILPGGS